MMIRLSIKITKKTKRNLNMKEINCIGLSFIQEETGQVMKEKMELVATLVNI